MMSHFEKYIRFKKSMVRYSFPRTIKIFEKKKNVVFQDEGFHAQSLSLSSRQPWIRLGVLLALTGYLGQIACQFLIVSGLTLVPSSPLEAMEREGAVYVASYTSASSITSGMADSATSYTGSNHHPLTHEFWKNMPPSDRLKRIKADIKELEEEIIHPKNSAVGKFCLRDEVLEKYGDIFRYSGVESDLALIGSHLYFMKNSIPKDVEPQHTPAIIRLPDHTYNLLVNAPNGVSEPITIDGINLDDLNKLFRDHLAQGKHFIEWNEPIMQYALFKGHHPLVTIHNQPITFSTRSIKGGSGCNLTILSRDKTNFIAIKKFSNVTEGLNELLCSLVALDMNSSPKELKMAQIYDGLLYSDNFYLIMEGANTGVIHSFLSNDSAENVVKACAEYFAKFHASNHVRSEKSSDGKKFLNRQARAANTLIGNLPKEDGREKSSLDMSVGEQWDENDFKDIGEDIKASNITRLLPTEEQESFIRLTESVRLRFKENSCKISGSLKADNNNEKIPYFYTRTHADGHGNNVFYNDDEKINGKMISKDSSQRVTMIDLGKIARTFGKIGDPSEDVGRFLGSLWDWFFLQDYTESGYFPWYKKIENFQNLFLEVYLNNIKKEVKLTEEEKKIFEKFFLQNCDFYIFRFFIAIFNFTKDEDIKKDKEIKLKVLRYWMNEIAKSFPNRFSQNPFQPNIFENTVKDRPWKSVDGSVVRFLPHQPVGFIESAPEGSDKSYLTRVWEAFHHAESSPLSPEVTIVGMGGIGKTSLALKYAYEALDHNAFNLVYWLPSETESSLLQGYRKLLVDMEVSIKNQVDNDIIALIKQHVPNRGRCLLIYDNVPNPEFLKGKTPPNTDILITSRYKGWNQKLDLNAFRREDSVNYLLTMTGFEPNKINQGKAKKLALELVHFPLALSHAASYIKYRGDTLESYLNKFKKNHSNHFETYQDSFEKESLEMTYAHLVARTYRMSSELISDVAKKLIIHCSYLAPDSIPEDMFLRYSQNEAEVQKDFDQLEALSLIKRQKNESLFFIHRLVQLVVRNEHEKIEIQEHEKNKELFLKMYNWFNENFMKYKDSFEIIDKSLNYLPHITILLEHSKRLKLSSQEIDSLEWIEKVLSLIELERIKKSIVLPQGNQPLKWKSEDNKKKLRQGLEKKMRSSSENLIGEKDIPKWLRDVGEQCCPLIQNALGKMYDENIFVKKDHNEAAGWFRKAANQKFANAQCNLGMMYYKGRGGVSQSSVEAEEFFREAANQGFAPAQFNLGIMHEEGHDGVPQSSVESLEWLTKAANQGFAPAQFLLGVRYEEGHGGVLQSSVEAVNWLTKAANQGFAPAQFALGVIYKFGYNDEQSIKQPDEIAVEWFTKAAKQKYPEAQYHLGVMYKYGRGVTKSVAQAVEWLTKAAKQDIVEAQYYLGMIYYEISIEERSNEEDIEWFTKEAIKWLTLAAKRKVVEAQFNLGIIYYMGRGVTKSVVQAVEWFTKAASQGFAKAQSLLKLMMLESCEASSSGCINR